MNAGKFLGICHAIHLNLLMKNIFSYYSFLWNGVKYINLLNR